MNHIHQIHCSRQLYNNVRNACYFKYMYHIFQPTSTLHYDHILTHLRIHVHVVPLVPSLLCISVRRAPIGCLLD